LINVLSQVPLTTLYFLTLQWLILSQFSSTIITETIKQLPFWNFIVWTKSPFYITLYEWCSNNLLYFCDKKNCKENPHKKEFQSILNYTFFNLYLSFDQMNLLCWLSFIVSLIFSASLHWEPHITKNIWFLIVEKCIKI